MPHENARPQTVYETSELTAEQIAEMNAAYKAMGLSAVVIDITPFCGKLELQQDGTYKRSTIRRARKPKHEATPHQEKPPSQ